MQAADDAPADAVLQEERTLPHRIVAPGGIRVGSPQARVPAEGALAAFRHHLKLARHPRLAGLAIALHPALDRHPQQRAGAALGGDLAHREDGVAVPIAQLDVFVGGVEIKIHPLGLMLVAIGHVLHQKLAAAVAGHQVLPAVAAHEAVGAGGCRRAGHGSAIGFELAAAGIAVGGI